MPLLRLRRQFLPFIALMLLAMLSHAQFGETSGALFGSSDQFLPVDQAYSASVSVPSADTVEIDWQMQPGYYLYRDRFDYHIAEAVEFSSEYETGIVKYDEFYEEELEVFYNETTVLLKGNFSSQEIILEYQGCADAGLCYPPAFYKFQLNPELGSANFLGKVDSAAFPVTTTEVGAFEEAANLGFLLAIAFAFVGGVILNIMPCVFPVLSLKAMSLAKGTRNRTDLMSQGLFYALGSVAVSVGLAAILFLLRTAGDGVGWGYQFRSPATITVLLYIFMVMGLSLSGAFIFGTSLMGLGQKLESKGNKSTQSFMTGALAMFVASPCTAPLMTVALTYAVAQPWFIGLPVFAFLGLGMALPIVVISLFPSLLEKIPKPGAWMETFKKLLAIPLYITCIWFLWMLVRQIEWLGTILILIGLVSLIAGLWAQQNFQGKFRWVLLGVSTVLTIGIAQAGISKKIEDSSTLSLAVISETTGGANPVFVNLTADWCITCLVNEKRALHTESTEQLFAQYDVEYIVGDWTRQSSDISEILAKHGRVSVPLYLFYPAYSSEPKILPQFLTNDTIADLFE